MLIDCLLSNCTWRTKPSVVFCPRIFFQIIVNHFLHCQIWNELLLRQLGPGYRVKVSNPLKQIAKVGCKVNGYL